MNTTPILNRVLRAARMDLTLFEEVEANPRLTQEALLVVVAASLLAGIGAFLQGLLSLRIGMAFGGLFYAVAMGVIGYYLWAYITQYVGTRFFDGTGDVGEVLRTLGYATAPTALGVLAFLPCIGPLAAFVGAVWSLVLGIIAVRQALDFTTGKAVLTAVIGWILLAVISAILALIFGIGPAWMGGFNS